MNAPILRLLPLVSVVAIAPLHGADLVLDSGPNRVRLLELYTSEGCSSCPPAEAWMAKLVENRDLWEDFVPVELHVNYWDRLGWKDPLASETNTDRQHRYAAHWNANTVYTPCFVLDGKPFKDVVTPPASTERAGVLRVVMRDATAAGERKIEISYAVEGTWRAYVAPLGFSIESNVRAGENRGKKLTHEFAALDLVSGDIDPDKKNATLTLPGLAKEERAVAVWVTKEGSPVPSQAVGGWLPGTRR